jgi:plastocyanin
MSPAESGGAARPYLRATVRRCALLALLAFLSAACGGGDGDREEAAPSESPLQTITITETDFALAPDMVAVEEPGTYAFEVVNEGETHHALEVEGEGIEEETETLAPGERATLTVELDAGTYELYCPVGDHADRGMTGKLEVAGAADDSGSGY